jgi:hypothetical protein
MPRVIVAVTLALVTLSLVACQQPPEPKPLAERILDRMVQRCKAMASKGTEAECVIPPGSTTREGLRAMHRALVKQGTTMFPRDGQCDLHGVYLICTKMIGDKTTIVMYRLDDAKDGSDSKVLSVWSQEW